jgi:hypothetical protein
MGGWEHVGAHKPTALFLDTDLQKAAARAPHAVMWLMSILKLLLSTHRDFPH